MPHSNRLVVIIRSFTSNMRQRHALAVRLIEASKKARVHSRGSAPTETIAVLRALCDLLEDARTILVSSRTSTGVSETEFAAAVDKIIRGVLNGAIGTEFFENIAKEE